MNYKLMPSVTYLTTEVERLLLEKLQALESNIANLDLDSDKRLDSILKREIVGGVLSGLQDNLLLRSALERGEILAEISVRCWEERTWLISKWDDRCKKYLVQLEQEIRNVRRRKAS